jgi:23S rRNA pseudouridine955/2504/2580 synthase
VTAELPPHFAESLAMLGFETSAGAPIPPEREKRAAAPQRKVAAVAKERRQARRGERRSRGSQGKAKRR